jgi:hypothetical protein
MNVGLSLGKESADLGAIAEETLDNDPTVLPECDFYH